MPDVLAADIGGTNLRLARIQSDGTIVKEIRAQADFSQLQGMNKPEVENHIIETLSNAAHHLLDKNIRGLGIGFPGFFLGNSGVLAASPNIPHLHHFPLAERLSHRLNIPVSAQNDALCAALGEARFGAGMGQDNLLHITLGTGIGGGVILQGEAYTGEQGMAMEFGHLRINYAPDANRCGCGGQGCVESYASATAISKYYTLRTGKHLSSTNIYNAARHGDPIAINSFNQAGHALGSALAEASKLLDIQTITISGGLSAAWDILYEPTIQSLNSQLIKPMQGKIRVLRSILHDKGGLLGAAEIAQQSMA